MHILVRRLAALAAILVMVGCVTNTGSSLGRFDYDAGAELLTVRFDEGGAYAYEGVPADIYEQIQASDSKGATFNQLVKGKFKSTKVSD